jgi:hypothetical protein
MRSQYPGIAGDPGRRRTNRAMRSPMILVFFTLAAGLAGCGSGNTPLVVNPSGTLASMPAPSTPTPANTYLGTDSLNVWSFQLNDSTNSYSYANTTTSSTPVTGTFSNSNGFLNLGVSGTTSLGYALEVQSRMALLRPGDASAGLVLSVPQTTCYSIPYRLLFDYIAIEAAPGGSTFETNSYASVVLNTDPTGADWQFQDLEGYLVYGPNSFSGACTQANGQATVQIGTGQSVFNESNNSSSLSGGLGNGTSTASTNLLAIGPSGVFLAQQSITGLPASAAGVAGVAEPTSALSTTSVAAGNYLGFLTQASEIQNGLPYTYPGYTSPVSFGPTSTSGATMTGGVFPNDDVTQTPNSDTIINLGEQSSTNNGLYPNATVTMLDPNQNCTTLLDEGGGAPSVTVGINADGYITCTYPAVAVVGNPEGKYVIFLDAMNWTANHVITTGSQGIGAPMQIYLFQQ